MRLCHRRQTAARPELLMTSMIDVVFLLLVYFLVTTAYWKTEQELHPAIEVRRSEGGAGAADVQPLIVDVTMGERGPVYRLGLREAATVQELRAFVREYPNKSSGAFVRVADDVPFGMAAAAVHACSAEHYVPVSYVPLPTPGRGGL